MSASIINQARGNIICPVHGMTDCSPLLNACSIVTDLTAIREQAFMDGAGVGRYGERCRVKAIIEDWALANGGDAMGTSKLLCNLIDCD